MKRSKNPKDNYGVDLIIEAERLAKKLETVAEEEGRLFVICNHDSMITLFCELMLVEGYSATNCKEAAEYCFKENRQELEYIWGNGYIFPDKHLRVPMPMVFDFVLHASGNKTLQISTESKAHFLKHIPEQEVFVFSMYEPFEMSIDDAWDLLSDPLDQYTFVFYKDGKSKFIETKEFVKDFAQRIEDKILPGISLYQDDISK